MSEHEIMLDMDAHFMGRALELAYQAVDVEEVPVGAIVVRDHSIIGAAHNGRESLKDPTAHAEMIAITQAAAAMEDWRLEGTTLYVTLEPCIMCSGAIILSRIPRVVFGASDPKGGAVESLYRLLQDDRLNHQCQVTRSVMADRCGRVLSEFFASKRKKAKSSLE